MFGRFWNNRSPPFPRSFDNRSPSSTPLTLHISPHLPTQPSIHHVVFDCHQNSRRVTALSFGCTWLWLSYDLHPCAVWIPCYFSSRSPKINVAETAPSAPKHLKMFMDHESPFRLYFRHGHVRLSPVIAVSGIRNVQGRSLNLMTLSGMMLNPVTHGERSLPFITITPLTRCSSECFGHPDFIELQGMSLRSSIININYFASLYLIPAMTCGSD
jgi:hypothetical protein